jgi:TetR/AcrR family transcriptional regulator, repressor of fatR-cypB operon
MNVHSAMTYTGSAQERSDRGDKRDRILDAALGLFAERGFHGTSVPEIAEAAGVAAGTIYRYFESKEQLVNALYQEHKGRLGHCLSDGFPWDAPMREQLRQVWHRVVTFGQKNPMAMAFLERHHHAPYLDDESRRIEGQLHALGTGAIEAAQRAQAVKDGPPDLIIAFLFGVYGGLMREVWAGRLEPSAATFDRAEELLWEAIRR